VDLINKLETMIQKEIQGVKTEDLIVYNYPESIENTLLVGYPYSDIYKQYLCAMIDLENAEYDNYQNDFQLFNSTYSEYSSYYLRENTPLLNTSIKNYW
jgi:hypothetical protein